MKRCATCGSTYEDEYDGCPKCAAPKEGVLHYLGMLISLGMAFLLLVFAAAACGILK